MSAKAHPLEPFFQQAVRNSYEGKLGLHDPEVTGYIARLLCEFSDAQNLYKVRDQTGQPIKELEEMLRASDPVNGSASSFDGARPAQTHRRLRSLRRRHVPGGISLVRAAKGPHAHLEELIRAGKESYYIVSQFDLFEYAQGAPCLCPLRSL